MQRARAVGGGWQGLRAGREGGMDSEWDRRSGVALGEGEAYGRRIKAAADVANAEGRCQGHRAQPLPALYS